MKAIHIPLTILAVTLIGLSINNDRILANSEKDKTISLNAKQWTILGVGTVVVFVACYFLLGLCCNSDQKTREQSSTLTTVLVDEPEEPEESEEPEEIEEESIPEEVPEETEEEPESQDPEPVEEGKYFSFTKL